MSPPTGMRPTRARYVVIGLCVLVAIITYADRIAISQAQPLLAKELGLTPQQMGWTYFAFFFAYALFEIPGGWMADRWGARKSLTRVVIMWSIFTAATGWAWGFWSLLFIRLFFGMGEAGAFPSVTRAFSDWLPAGERARAQGILWLSARWGGAFTPLLVAGMMSVVSWRTVFEIFGVIGVLWAILFFRWYRDRPEHHPAVNKAELKLLEGRTTASTHGPIPWGPLLRSRSVKLLWAQYMCINFTWPFYITWLPTYLQEARGLPPGQGALLSGMPLFFGGFGCLLAGLMGKRLAARYDIGYARRVMPMIGCTSAAVFLLIFPQIPNPYLAMVILGLASFSNDLLMPSAWATCMDIGGKHAGVVSGSMNMMGNLFAALSAPTVGYILAVTNKNYNILFYIGAGFYLLGTLSWAYIDPRERLDGAPARATAPVPA
jgi:ACS family glucarate transporter-like MFS transporter